MEPIREYDKSYIGNIVYYINYIIRVSIRLTVAFMSLVKLEK